MTSIAIIGVQCRFPGGADSPEKLWELLINGTNTWSEVPKDRFNEKAFFHPHPDDTNGTNNHAGGHFLTQDVRDFDNEFFNISAQEAAGMDPQQRILLETVYEALESAGQQQHLIRGSATSVHVALFTRDYDRNIFKDTLSVPRYQITGVGDAIAANRISHAFDFTGPSVALDTGCSGGLVAVHQACNSLRLGESDMAIAAAANLILSPDHQIAMSNLHMLNDEGRSYPFDDRGSGYGRGEGVAALILKRMDKAIEDGDPIRGVILGSAINQDGRTIEGITHPSSIAQASLEKQLYKKMNIDPTAISYVEAHGTGTAAGDRVEMDALSEVFCEGKTEPLYVGSIKSNIGHLECASGLAGLIKSLLILEHGCIPPNADFVNPKDGLRLTERNIKIPTAPIQWPEGAPAQVSVNSFGYGGTNAHLLLESAPQLKEVAASDRDDASHLFTFSAKSETSLINMIRHNHAWLSSQGTSLSLSSLSHTLCRRRTHHPWRFSCVSKSHQDLADQLASAARAFMPAASSEKATLNFVFTGQGAQYPKMAHELLTSETKTSFKSSIDRSNDILVDLGANWGLVDEILRDPDTSRLHLAELAQPATTAIQIALIDLLKEMQVYPDNVIGHSSGEIAAAYAAGYISQATAIRISYCRGLATSRRKSEQQRGAMLAVGLGEEEISKHVQGLTKGTVSVACANSPQNTTISGDEEAIDELAAKLSSMDVFNRKLRVDAAYHSHHMRSVSDEYKSLMGLIECRRPEAVPKFFSTVAASEKIGGFDAEYWCENLVSKVRFKEGMQALSRSHASSRQIFVEIGPHNALAGPTRQCITDLQEKVRYDYISLLKRGTNAIHSALESVGTLYERGKLSDLSMLPDLGSLKQPQRVLYGLPSYSWNHSKKHWHESRLSRDYRLRTHPYHDLVGLKSIETTSFEPRWRYMVSLDSLPWLADHVVDGVAVFPGSGYMCMAIEAISQLAKDHIPGNQGRRVILKNIEFVKALLVPDSPQKTEVQITFSPEQSSSNKIKELAFYFRVSAYTQDQTWDEHCHGYVRIEDLPSDDQSMTNGHHQHKDALSSDQIYQGLRENGNAYGPMFNGIKDMSISDDHGMATIIIPDVASVMPSSYMQLHTIHPTTLDIIMHTSLPLASQKFGPGSIMPIHIDEVIVSTEIDNTPGAALCVYTDLAATHSRNAELDIEAFNDRNGVSGLSFSGVKLRILPTSTPVKEVQHETKNICWDAEWRPDVDHISAAHFKPAKIDDTQTPSLGYKVHAMNDATARYIQKCIDAVNSNQLTISDEHKLLFDWMQREGLERSSELPNGDSSTEMSKFSEMDIVARTGEQLTGIVSGSIDALQLVTEDGLLYGSYQDHSSVLCYDLLRQYVSHMSFKKSKLRILEIGGGTGGATLPFLQTMKAAGVLPEAYHFTDVSTSFFERAGQKFAEYPIDFRRLDIEKDPAQQGFESGSYDIVLAFNCLHVTSSIRTTLKNARSLLRADGRLVLIEIVNAQPYHHISYGTLPGYWKGSVDGRPNGPFMPIDQWRQCLHDTEMDMQLCVKDDENAHISSLMVARPLRDIASKPADKIQIIPVAGVSDSLTDGIASVFKEGSYNATIACLNTLAEGGSEVKIILDNGDNPLLSNLTSEAFQSTCALINKHTHIMWITAGSNPESYSDPRRHLITGLARSAQAENEGLRLITVDVQQNLDTPKTQTLLLNVLQSSFFRDNANPERELIIRDDTIVIPRLLPDAKLNKWVSREPQITHIDQLNFRNNPLVLLEDAFIGTSSHIFGVDQTHRAPLSGEDVQVQVHAVRGSVDPSDSVYYEYSGVVTALGSEVADFQIGDQVMAISTSRLASHLRVSASLTRKIPEGFSLSTAAALPLALMATDRVLLSLMRGLPSGKILLHGISNITIQTMLQYLQKNSAEVVVFASEPAELSLLEKLGVPKSSIVQPEQYSKRARRHQSGDSQRLDAIITSDVSELSSGVPASLKPFGTIVQLQSDDTHSKHQLDLPPNVSMHTFDMDAYLRAYPNQAHQCIERAAEIMETCKSQLAQLPVTARPIERISELLVVSQSPKPIETTVFEVHDNSTVPTIRPGVGDYQLDPDATYVISGGLGDLGRKLFVKLAKHGAKHLVSLSRRSEKIDSLQQLVSEVSPDCKIYHIQCDIAQKTEVGAAVARIVSLGCPPVRGVIQSAHTLQDRSLDSMSLDSFNLPLDPKLKGTLNLQKAFDTPSLNFFIMLSSAANIVGTRGQANYNAGNAVQDALAQASKHKQCHYLSISPSMVEGTSAVQNPDIRKALQRSGLAAIQEPDMDALFTYVLSPTARAERIAHIAVGFTSDSVSHAETTNGTVHSPFFAHVLGSGRAEAKAQPKVAAKTQTFKEILEGGDASAALTYATATVAKKLSGLTYVDAESMELDKPIAEFGLDSLIAIELRNWIKREFGAALQSLEILNERGIGKLAERIVKKVVGKGVIMV